MAETPYRRLTWARRRRSGFVAFTHTRSSLWLGDDHLLGIDSNGYTESYKRFYFRDIQAVTIRLTQRRLIWNWLLGVPTLICLAGWGYDLSLGLGASPGGLIAGVLVTPVFAIPLLINNLRGPTCACQFRTAVQTEDLPSLSRLPQARRILDRLHPLIAQAQGQVAPEEIGARLREWAASSAAANATPAGGARYVVDDPNAPPRIIS